MSESFSRPGAIDLSGLKQKAQAAQAPTAGAAGSFVQQVDEQSFNDLIARSQQFPVVVEFYSPRAQDADQLSQSLANKAAAAGGRFLLARVNVDANPRIAQAVGIQAVPTVLALLMGQALPLFQGVQPPEQVKAVIDQVLEAAVANGLVGRVEPAAGGAGGAEGEPGDTEEPVADPRFAAADDALDRGDFAAARDEFDKLLQANPNDAEALAGKAQAGLLARTVSLDADAVLARAAENPLDVPTALEAADVDLASGRAEDAFARLVALVRVTSGDDRDTVRTRLLELFETLGNTDQRVLRARRDLASALF